MPFSFQTQTIPDASEKDVTSRNQTHAPRKRRGRMPCASSFRLHYAWQKRKTLNLTPKPKSYTYT